MTEDINVLLCFDSNYNFQAEVTITSLLQNSSALINFYIIHDNPETFEDMKIRLLGHHKIKNINIYKFVKRSEVKFPNFDESHMTEATYYRLFIADYIPQNVPEIMYIDPDIICINKFDDLYKMTMENLRKSSYILAARTEHIESVNSETATRLELTNNKYFNAGVTFINYKKWFEENYTEKLVLHMNYLGDRVFWYDQDIMNSYVNGMYYELSSKLNYTDIYTPIQNIKNDAVLFHYWGKMKPWTIKGVLNYGESFYQRVYKSIFEENYHIVHRYKKDSLKHFIILVFSLKIFRLESPLKFIKNFIFSLRG